MTNTSIHPSVRQRVFRLLPVFVPAFFICLALSGCATKVRVNMLQPAAYHQASLTKAVAVVPFGGPDGTGFAAEIEGVLASINIDDRPYFSLVDRQSLNRIISEQKFSQSGLVDPNTAAKLGRMVGAQGIYTGTVTASDVKEQRYREQRRECIEREAKKKDAGFFDVPKCLKYRNYNVNCLKRDVTFAVTPKLIDVSTGRVLYSRNLGGSTSSSGCSDGAQPKGGDELLEQVKGTARAQFRKDVAPFYVTVEIALMDMTDGIATAEPKDALKRGVEYAGRGRLDAACEIWGAARIQAPTSPALLYNLGVCAESRGDADAALSLYRQADKLLGKPDDDITAALNRVSAVIKNRMKLQQQLHPQG
ncbi:MAG TPA: CsgG/HfaB family protein [Syntrophales bacterium]|jgi:hypothetical protein|nr:hypothetical protein [Armatimonadota bacterium]HOI73098.1 CsgG/HfaB family protein [Syntrophales bacterium]